MTPTARLLAAVEADEWPNKIWADGSEVPAMVLGFSEDRYALSADHGSTDAAIALCEAMLPGWAVEIVMRPFGIKPHLWHVTLSTDHTGWGNGKYICTSTDTPARALLIAVLRALVAKEGATTTWTAHNADRVEQEWVP